jgi:hypothetical protein
MRQRVVAVLAVAGFYLWSSPASPTRSDRTMQSTAGKPSLSSKVSTEKFWQVPAPRQAWKNGAATINSPLNRNWSLTP